MRVCRFQKFNSNTGWSSEDGTEWPAIMQAVTHFSYHFTGGDMVLCDLQGGFTEEGVVITDPAISSNDCRFGNTDLGRKGMEAVMARHRCTRFCRSHWTRPKSRDTSIPILHGSSMRSDDGYLMTGPYSRAIGVPRLDRIKGAPLSCLSPVHQPGAQDALVRPLGDGSHACLPVCSLARCMRRRVGSELNAAELWQQQWLWRPRLSLIHI